jgi:hypothetical protein
VSPDVSGGHARSPCELVDGQRVTHGSRYSCPMAHGLMLHQTV